MKKTLVTLLALVFVLSIGTAAFAAPANPFVDVPAKHWSYDAVSKLAQAGIVDGYGDGTFRGDKTISRYEMAQIVAKAMAKSDKADAENKALIDKLAVEFASELNNLGVRVAKLEANASSVKMSGDLRIRYTNKGDHQDNTKLRLGLNFKAAVNDNVSFTGRIIAENAYSNDPETKEGVPTGRGGDYDGKFTLEQAYVTVKDLGGVNLKVGRQPLYLGQGTLYDADYFDGGLVTFGNALKVSFGYGDIGIKATPIFKASANNFNTFETYPVSVLNLSYDATSNLNLTAAALYSNTNSYVNKDGEKHEWQAYGLNYKMGEDYALVGEFVRDANADKNKDGWYAQLNYKGAKQSVPGSYGLYAGYANMKENAFDGDLTTFALTGPDSKGIMGGFSYTVGKNIIWSADVYDSKVKSSGDNQDTTWRTTVKFWF